MSDSSKKTVIAFDVYGTLLSTESIAKKLASHFGQEKAQSMAATWRKYQLEYTWRLNSMNQYEDFSALTLRSLKHTLAEAGESLKQSEIDDLMKAYDSLSTFPEVGPALVELAKHENITAVVFSNGTRKMVENSVNHSPDLAPHAKVFQHVVVVEKIKKFKPAPEVYYHLAETVGKGKDRKEMGQMWLVSGNPFDVVGARAVGMQACWVDRAGNGWQDSVVEGGLGRPTAIVKGLDEVVDVVAKHAG
ncbi:hypothetical protein LTR66_001449 [Elasticomyces elasticus]|nr:hypothetical protein LTR50_002337 [Elasticomyces elasticus]KAK4999524.1 hypothetical protein LTR66_001449 [Elasticomyces elasticus]